MNTESNRADPLPEQLVASHVTRVSEQMEDPKYAERILAQFAANQPDIIRFLTSHADELGGPEGIVHAVFHCHFIVECITEHHGSPAKTVTFDHLHRSHTGRAIDEFDKAQPALSNYLGSNIEDQAILHLLALVGLTLVRFAAP